MPRYRWSPDSTRMVLRSEVGCDMLCPDETERTDYLLNVHEALCVGFGASGSRKLWRGSTSLQHDLSENISESSVLGRKDLRGGVGEHEWHVGWSIDRSVGRLELCGLKLKHETTSCSGGGHFYRAAFVCASGA